MLEKRETVHHQAQAEAECTLGLRSAKWLGMIGIGYSWVISSAVRSKPLSDSIDRHKPDRPKKKQEKLA